MNQILGPDGKPIPRQRLAEPQSAYLGTIASELSDHPAKGLTPARLAAVLLHAEHGALVQQLDLADDIEERDGHAFAELAKRRLAVASLPWEVRPPAGASAAEMALTEAVREWLASWDEMPGVIAGMMDAVLKGFAMHELVWKPDGRFLRPRASFAPQRWFKVATDRRTLLLRAKTGSVSSPGVPGVVSGAEGLLPYAWIAHVHVARSGYVARNGLVRVLAWPFLFKHYAVRDLAEFLEIVGIPVRLGRYPAGASNEEKQTLLRAVAGIGHNAAGIIPAGMAIDFRQAATGQEGPFVAMWDRMEAVESKVILGQTLTAGEGKHGSQALGRVHNEVRHDIRDADARQIERTINAQLIKVWCTVNWPNAVELRLPKWRLDTGCAADLQAYAKHLPALAGAGLRIAVDWAHERLRIPRAGPDQAVILAPPAPAPAPSLQAGAEALSAARSDGRFSWEDMQSGSPRLATPESLTQALAAVTPPKTLPFAGAVVALPASAFGHRPGGQADE